MENEPNEMTLAGLLTNLEDSEDNLVAFDPQTIVGSVKDKIDSIHFVLSKMKSTTEYLKEIAKPITAKAKAIDVSRDRLREYVAFQMKEHGFENLPGNKFKASLRSNPERLVVIHENGPTTQEAMLFPHLTKTRIEFDWDEEKILAAYQVGEVLPPEITIKSMQSFWVVFTPLVPESLEPKKKTKAKKEETK